MTVDVGDVLDVNVTVDCHGLHLNLHQVTQNIATESNITDVTSTIQNIIESDDISNNSTTVNLDSDRNICLRELHGCNVRQEPTVSECFYIDRSLIFELNETTTLLNTYIEMTRRLNGNHAAQSNEPRLIVFSSSLSLFTIVSLKQRLINEVCFIGLDTSLVPLVQRLLDVNDVSRERVLFKDTDSDDVIKNWDVLFAEVVDVNGCLRQNVLEDLTAIR